MTTKTLVEFGNYLLEVNKVKNKKTKDIKQVSHADLENFKESKKKK